MSKKMKEMRTMSAPQLNERLSQLRMELVKFNTQVATGTAPKSPGLIRQAKRNVARILTLLNTMGKTEAVKPMAAQAPKAKAPSPKTKKKEAQTKQ